MSKCDNMKKLLIIIAFLISIKGHAQSSIAGVKFGETYDKASELLKVKFGNPDSEDGKEIVFADSFYAGLNFDLIMFGFQRGATGSYFNRCIFIKSFKTADKAKLYRDDIVLQLKKRYTLISEVGKNGFKCYYGGVDPTDSKKDGFCLEILSPTPEIKWYGVRLYYGPYDYLNEEF